MAVWCFSALHSLYWTHLFFLRNPHKERIYIVCNSNLGGQDHRQYINQDKYLKALILFCLRCFGEETCLSVPDVKAVVMVLPPSEPRITISGSNRLVRPASDLRAPLGVAPFKEMHLTSTVMRADGLSGCESRRWTSLCDESASYKLG